MGRPSSGRAASLRQGLAAAIVTVGELAVLAWAGWWAWAALTGWLQWRRCLYISGPFLPCGPGGASWRQALLIALLPAAAIGLGACAGRLVRRLRALRTPAGRAG